MAIDRYTRAVLTVIALALVLLVARGLLEPASVTAQAPVCGDPARPCRVIVVGGPQALGEWSGLPVLMLDSQRVVPK